MSFAKFSEALKASKDLLSKPYPEASKIDFKATAVSGPVFTVEALLGDAPAPAKGKLAIASLAFKGEGVVFGGFKVDKAAVDTNGEIAADFSLADAVKDTKFIFKARDGSRVKATEDYETSVASFSAEYKAGPVTANAEADVFKQALSFSLVGGHAGFFAGVAGTVGPHKETKAFGPTDYNALLGYKAGDLTLAVVSDKSLSTATFGYHHVINSFFTAAATAKFAPIPTGKDAIEVSAGFTYKASADTTLAGKVSVDAKEKRTVDFSYAQQLNSLAKITIGASVDAANLAKADHKLAMSLSLSA